jgi:hypothetical protein
MGTFQCGLPDNNPGLQEKGQHEKGPRLIEAGTFSKCGSDRRRSGDLSIFSRTLYQLSYRAWEHLPMITEVSEPRPETFSDPDGT